MFYHALHDVSYSIGSIGVTLEDSTDHISVGANYSFVVAAYLQSSKKVLIAVGVLEWASMRDWKVRTSEDTPRSIHLRLRLLSLV
jgi:hypothetical protein